MKLPLCAVVLTAVILLPLSAAEEGRFLTVRGKVEIQEPGRPWAAAAAGMSIGAGAVISTGFSSRAVIKLENAELEVNPLSRLSLGEIVRRKNTLKTDLNLRVGKIRVELKADPSLKSEFMVKSPVSTAAVRGTVFTFDGRDLEVSSGVVSLGNKLGWARRYTAGQGGSVSPGGKFAAASTILEAETSPSVPAGGVPAGNSPRNTAAPADVISGTGRLTIVW